MNNKGFSLIEMLAAVAILGILGTIAVISTTKYLESTRYKSYVMMSKSTAEAMENCIIHGNNSECRHTTTLYSVKTDYLLENGYLKDLKNPRSGHANCTGEVKVIPSTENNETINYQYEVTLNCPGFINKTITWPDDRKIKEIVNSIHK